MNNSLTEYTDFSPARRALLATAAASAFGLAGCSKFRNQTARLTGSVKTPYVPLTWHREKSETARLVLNRVAFGPDSGAVNRASEMGAANWLEEQLQDKMDEDPIVAWRVDSLEVLQSEKDAPDVLTSMSDEAKRRLLCSRLACAMAISRELDTSLSVSVCCARCSAIDRAPGGRRKPRTL